MKLVKKSLILASTIALGLTITGCKKKSNILKDVKPSILETSPTQYSSQTLKVSFEEVRDYSTIGSRYVRYLTAQGKTAVYDYKLGKEIFSTEEDVSSIYLYSEVILLVTYLDGSQEMLFVDGTKIYEKATYDNIFAGNLEYKYTYKADNYEEIIAYTYNDEPGKDIEYNYYSITYKGKKTEDKKIVKDYSSFTITKLTADDVKKYHEGDKVIEDGKYYSYATIGDTIVYYNTGSNKPVLSITANGTKRTIVSGTKAILQVQEDSDEYGNYDVYDGNDYYNIDTYLIDLKSGTYKRLDDFNYFLLDQATWAYTKNYFYFRHAGKIEGNNVICYNDITVCTSNGKINDNQKYAYYTYYTDLKNGYYLTSYDSKVYLTNKNGEIKKVFEGSAKIFSVGKVIAIYSNNKYRFINFKGEYISDIMNINSTFDISLDSMYYRTTDGKNCVMKFADGKIASTEEVDYSVTDIDTHVEDIRSNIYYIEEGNYYFKATSVTIDNYGDTTSCDLEFKQVGSDSSIGKMEGVTYWSSSVSTTDEGKSAKYYFVCGEVSEMTASYTLSIYEIA